MSVFLLIVTTAGSGWAKLTPFQKCQAAKIQAVIKAAQGDLECHQDALKKGLPLDPACPEAVKAQLADDFAKAEAKGGCGTVDDAVQTTAGIIEPFAAQVASQLPGSDAPICTCGASPPTRLVFTTALGAGNCGSAVNSSGALVTNLACGDLYIGGGLNSVPPVTQPDLGTSIFKVTGCFASTLALANTTAAETFSPLRCTSTGCKFGPPIPAPNPGSPPVSVCLIESLTQDATGYADCAAGSADISLPINAEIYLTGDLLPSFPGTQPCPVCAKTCSGGPNDTLPCQADVDCPAAVCVGSLVCHAGPNSGFACVPGTSATLGSAYPTSHDCPPAPGLDIGGIPFGLTLTTRTETRTATQTGASQGQVRVFCGFCRNDVSAGQGSGGFGLCSGGSNDGLDCAPSGFDYCPGGTCGNARRCLTNADCDALRPECAQRDNGAFGPAGGGVKTITEVGVAAAPLTTGGPAQTATLVNLFCIAPTFTAVVDAAADFPGPAAISLPGQLQLLP